MGLVSFLLKSLTYVAKVKNKRFAKKLTHLDYILSIKYVKLKIFYYRVKPPLHEAAIG